MTKQYVPKLLLLLLLYTITPLLLYLGAAKTGCTSADPNLPYLSIYNLRSCFFNKKWIPAPFAIWRIDDWRPSQPLTEGLSTTFNPSTTCPRLKDLQLVQIQSQLQHWKTNSITPLLMLNGEIKGKIGTIHDGRARFRIQIIDGVLYGVPPDCCPGSPRWDKSCCNTRLGPREKFVLGMLWTLINFYGTKVPNVYFYINTRDEPSGAEFFLKDAPIFSFSNLNNGKSVRIPIGGIGNPKSNAGLAQNWKKRKSKVIWRGGPTGYHFDWKHAHVENIYNQKYHKLSHPRVKLCHFAGLHEDLLDFAFSGNSISSFPTNEISCNISKKHARHEHFLSYDQQQNNYKYVLDVQGFR